jgi:hypothetical protein
MFNIQEESAASLAELLAGADMGSCARRTASSGGSGGGAQLGPGTPSPQHLRSRWAGAALPELVG